MEFYLNNKRITKKQAFNYYIKMLGNNIAKQTFEKDITMLKNTLSKNEYSCFWQLKIVMNEDFTNKYQRAKNNARAQIIDILEQNQERAMSWGEYAEQQAIIYKIAKRCGLVKELHNEGII